jgi:hypothetical protein
VDLNLFFPYMPSWRGQVNPTFVIIIINITIIIIVIVVVVVVVVVIVVVVVADSSGVMCMLARLKLGGLGFKS